MTSSSGKQPEAISAGGTNNRTNSIDRKISKVQMGKKKLFFHVLLIFQLQLFRKVWPIGEGHKKALAFVRSSVDPIET